MIPLKPIPWQSDAWTRALADAITDPHVLLERLELDDANVDFAPDFPLRVPVSFVERMRVRRSGRSAAATGSAAADGTRCGSPAIASTRCRKNPPPSHQV